MGSYKDVYVGVYLEVPFIKSEEVKISYKHPVTGGKMQSRFCKDTGVEDIKVETKVPRIIEPSPYIVDIEGYEEDMFSTANYGIVKNKTIFMLNKKSKYRYSDDDSFCYAITVSPAELIEDFKVEFSKYLDYYKNLYGEFEINYGVVSYYN